MSKKINHKPFMMNKITPIYYYNGNSNSLMTKYSVSFIDKSENQITWTTDDYPDIEADQWVHLSGIIENNHIHEIVIAEQQLFNAISQKNNKNLTKILSCPVNVDAKNASGMTPLMIACAFQNIEIVRKLLSLKANPLQLSSTPNHRYSAFSYAVPPKKESFIHPNPIDKLLTYEQFEILKLLLYIEPNGLHYHINDNTPTPWEIMTDECKAFLAAYESRNELLDFFGENEDLGQSFEMSL